MSLSFAPGAHRIPKTSLEICLGKRASAKADLFTSDGTGSGRPFG